jgi:hypothetical protein
LAIDYNITYKRGSELAYGMTMKEQQRFSVQIAEIINVDASIIAAAMDEITRREVRRVARGIISDVTETG